MKIFVVTFFLIFFVVNAEAISIYKVKGKKALIYLQGASVHVGQKLNVADINQKIVGVILVSKINKNEALVTILSGQINVKNKIVIPSTLASARASSKESKSIREQKAPEGPRPPYYASVLLGLASNTLSIKVGNGLTTQDVDNTGNSVGVALAVDRQFFQPWFKARALFAYEQFNAIGAATINGCNNQTSKDCQTDIKYLSAGGYAKYDKEYSQFHFWGAVGLNVKMPVSKSSTALVESSLGATASYGLTLGTDFTLESKKFLTASIEKQFFIKSDSAETTTIFVRLGVGKEF